MPSSSNGLKPKIYKSNDEKPSKDENSMAREIKRILKKESLIPKKQIEPKNAKNNEAEKVRMKGTFNCHIVFTKSP